MPDKPILKLVAYFMPWCIFVAVYAPCAGHGFMLDDYDWILISRITHSSDILRIFTQNNGFYRPLVSLMFSLDYLFFGISPLGYGLTNLALAALCGWLTYYLARALRLPEGASMLAGALWLTNVHGINMAVLWISGRTSLLVTAFSLSAAISVVRKRPFVTATFVALALLSKEEAVVLPLLLASWMVVLEWRDSALWIRMGKWLVLSVGLWAGYFVLRLHSGAMTPASAPSYYHLTIRPGLIVRNVFEYADRGLTISAVATTIAWLILRKDRIRSGSGVRMDVVRCGALWFIAGYAITVFVPVRSSLYACLPSVGGCLIAAELCRSLWVNASHERRRAALISGIALNLLLVPILYSRTRRFVAPAELGASIWQQLPPLTDDLAPGSAVLVLDDPTHAANVQSAFGTLLGEAYRLRTGRDLIFYVRPSGAAGSFPQVARIVALEENRLVRVR